MKKITFSLFFALLAFTISAQQSETTYWSDFFTHEVLRENAVYSIVKRTHPDGNVSKEIIVFETGEIIDREIFRGDEPQGLWIKTVEGEKVTIDYDFDLIYSDSFCTENDSIPDKLVLLMLDDLTLGYSAPCIESGEKTIFDYLRARMFTHYPFVCNNSAFKPGKVILEFIITPEGNITNIAIVKSTNAIYDKEAYRLIRELKLSNPPVLNGKGEELCFRCPILFDPVLICHKK